MTILLSSILILFLSYQEYMVNLTRTNGNWEARFSNIEYSIAQEISKDENIKQISLYQKLRCI